MKRAILAAVMGFLSVSAFAQPAAPMAAPADNATPAVHHHHKHRHTQLHHHAVTAQGDEIVKP